MLPPHMMPGGGLPPGGKGGPPGGMPPGGMPPGGMMPPPGGMMPGGPGGPPMMRPPGGPPGGPPGPGAPLGQIVPGGAGAPPAPVPGAVNPVPGAVNGAPAPDAGDPSLTLYVNNLNDKIHAETLKKNLTEVFGAFGEIQDIVCMKSIRRRGQSWIVFKELSASAAALKALQGFPFYNKPIRIAYAKAKSDVVSKADGTFQPRAKIKNKADRKDAQAAAQALVPPMGMPPGMGMPPMQPRMPENTVPSRTLFVENLPPDANDQSLNMLFRQYPGFTEVRTIAGRNVAFADFMNESQAQQAMGALQGFAFTPQHLLKLTFAR